MNQGFTLVELLVVVLIIGVLSAVALPQYTTSVEKSRAAEALTILGAWHQSAERYKLQKNKWPETLNKLDVEIPASGKSFNFSATGGGGTGEYVITATRNAGAPYSIRLHVSSNGNFYRECIPGSDTKTQKYCLAISNGTNSNF